MGRVYGINRLIYRLIFYILISLRIYLNATVYFLSRRRNDKSCGEFIFTRTPASLSHRCRSSLARVIPASSWTRAPPIDSRSVTNIRARFFAWKRREYPESKFTEFTLQRWRIILLRVVGTMKSMKCTHDVANSVVILVVNSWPVFAILWHFPGPVQNQREPVNSAIILFRSDLSRYKRT